MLDLRHGAEGGGWRGRRWIQREEFRRQGIRKLGCDETGELRRLHTHDRSGGRRQAQVIEAAENERLVLDDGPARREPVLVAARGRQGGLKLRARSQRVVGVKLRKRSVILVRSGLGEHLDQRSAVAALLGREGVRRYPNLLDGIGLRRQIGDSVA